MKIRTSQIALSLFCVLSTACSSGGALMTMNSFHDIPIGATTSEVVAAAGDPYRINKRKDGTVEYEYIERIKAGNRDLQERRYILILKDGKVVSKEVKGEFPSPYLFDSYEMQTTQNNGSED